MTVCKETLNFFFALQLSSWGYKTVIFGSQIVILGSQIVILGPQNCHPRPPPTVILGLDPRIYNVSKANRYVLLYRG